jgi:pimeloyl-ACP methyl ester carboxylesterase
MQNHSSIMQSSFISYRSSVIHYVRMGEGSRLVLCFHGYGEEGTAYSFLEKYNRQDFTFYAIDLPFHGQTEWNEGLLFTHLDLQQIIEEILAQGNSKLLAEPCGKTKNSKLSLLGFSLGARIALSLYQSQPARIEKLVLLAPDGLKINFWYWLATQTWPGNRFFALTMKHPGWFFGFLKLLNRLKLVNISIFKFINYYIGDKEVRRLLYARWTTLRKLKPNLQRIRSFISDNKTPVRLIYGQHDRIMLSPVGERFRKGIEDYCTITLIHSGHQVLQEKHAEEILKALLH